MGKDGRWLTLNIVDAGSDVLATVGQDRQRLTLNIVDAGSDVLAVDGEGRAMAYPEHR